MTPTDDDEIPKTTTCWKCGGTGVYYQEIDDDDEIELDCNVCEGLGFITDD